MTDLSTPKKIITLVTSIVFTLMPLYILLIDGVYSKNVYDIFYIYSKYVLSHINMLYMGMITYMTYDSVRMLLFDVKYDFLVHHALMILIFSTIYIYSIAHKLVVMFILYESTNIFLSILNFQNDFKIISNNIKMIKLMFAIAFFVIRILFGSYLTYVAIMCCQCIVYVKYPIVAYVCGLLVTLFHILNIYWFCLILSKAFKQYIQKKDE